MDASLDTIIEIREELMVSPSNGSNPTHRTAYFLKPSMSCNKDPPRDDLFLPPHSLTSITSKLALEVRHHGWLNPYEEWKTWVQKLQPKYEHLWVQSGIDQAIKTSTYQINKNDELILALAQRWCSKTNTFIFPWGEATITLEDVKVCGDFSVLGDPIFLPLETKELKEKEAKLVESRRIFNSTKAKKVIHKPWMMHFMENESQVEHEAFLVLWLSRFVFPANAHNTILKSVFPIAIHLARGTRIALAPAVLASIYRDLTLLNKSINSATMDLRVTLWAPFQLVQVWALERFTALQPHPHNAIQQGQPIMARWHRVKIKLLKNNKLNLVLDSAGARNCFLWRPYKNSPSLNLYNEKDKWECENPSVEDELQSFTRCLRVCELVGMGCREQYLPHRIAMQFGLDQDIPAMVVHCNENPWIYYEQPVMDTKLCTVLCASQANVTSRYYDWWKQLKLGKEGDSIKGYDDDHCTIMICSSENLSRDSCMEVEGEGSYGPPPGFNSKFKGYQVGCPDEEDKLTINEILSSCREVRCCEDEVLGRNGKALCSSQFGVLQSTKMGDDETIAGSMTGGVYNFPQRNDDVLRGSSSAIEDGQMKHALGGPKKDKNDDDEDKMKSPSCDKTDIESDLENRICELQRVVAKLNAVRFRPMVGSIGAKAKP